MIVIEGMDNSGKSTLAVFLANALNRMVQESEGPPLSDEEINERVDRYYDLKDTVFVRHPVISNSIYGQVRSEGDPITPGRADLFYEQKPILIYCDAGLRGLGSHVVKDHDTPQHLLDITNNYNKLLYLYRQWAAERAHMIYRIGDDRDALIDTVIFLEARLNGADNG
jgi:hypothetical protein